MAALLALAGGVLIVLEAKSDTGRRIELVLASVESDANRLGVLEWQVIRRGRLTQAERAELDVVQAAIARGVDEFARLDPDDVDEMRAAQEALVTALEDELSLVAVGRLEDAEAVDRERVDPAYEAFVDVVGEQRDSHVPAAERASLVVTLLLAFAAMAVLVLRYERAQAAHAEAVARERLFAEQNEHLREVDRLKDALVSTVSHELRTPLTSIRGYLELLENDAGEFSDEQRRFLVVVKRNAERLRRVVEDLLFISHIESGAMALEAAEVELEAVVAESVEALRPKAAEKGVELTLELEPVPPLAADRARLAQVIDNLVSNAIKFTPASGSVEVRVGKRGERAVLEVADSGIGIPAEERERLFQRFFRASAATRSSIPGTGLGLAIAKAIVEAHGGSIAVESAEGVGTSFRVELPLRLGRAAPAATLAGAAA